MPYALQTRAFAYRGAKKTETVEKEWNAFMLLYRRVNTQVPSPRVNAVPLSAAAKASQGIRPSAQVGTELNCVALPMRYNDVAYACCYFVLA